MSSTKIHTKFKTSTTSITIAASLMLATSSMALFLSWGMIGVAVGFAFAPKIVIRIAAVPEACTDADADGYGIGCFLGADCNDNNVNIHPGATEICGDGKDNDCDGFSYNTCYYIDGANGNDANNGLSLSTAWRTIDKADSALLAGNAVLIRVGTYSQSISPLNNGNSGNPIVYTSYNKEKVTITQRAVFTGKSYIAVKGLRFFSTGSRWVTTDSLSHHIEFLDNYFNSSFDTNDPSVSYSGFYTDGSYIIIRGNFFEKWWGGDMVRTGSPSHHILFEDNDLSQATAAHASVHFIGTDSIIRNNYFHNPWERAVEMVRVDNQKGERILIENNVFVDNDWDRISFNPSESLSEKGSGETVRYNVLRSILRNNIIIGHNLGKNYAYDGAVGFSVYPGSYTFEKIRMYHNTLHRNRLNGITFTRNVNLDPSLIDTADNRYKNNIISETENYSIYVDNSGIDWRAYLFERNVISDTKKTGTVYIRDLSNRIRTVASLENEFPNVFKNNIVNKPLFVRESILDEAEARPQNFRLSNVSDFFDAYTLTSTSPGKGQGTHLASVTVLGTGTRITLDDALYFSDGFGLIDGDALIIGNDLVKVIKIVDDTRIDVNRSITVQSGDKVYLALSGSSPDIGVYGIEKSSQPQPLFFRGNADGSLNNVTNISDAVYTLRHLFSDGPVPSCMDAADSNDDGFVNFNDAVYTLRFLFQGGPEPLPPGPFQAGTDPTPDNILCAQSQVQAGGAAGYVSISVGFSDCEFLRQLELSFNVSLPPLVSACQFLLSPSPTPAPYPSVYESPY